MKRIHLLFLTLASCCPVNGVLAAIVVPNGDIESSVTNVSFDITSSATVATGNWHGSGTLARSSADNGPSAAGSNSLRRADTGSGFAGNIREYSRYNFIDIAGESGLNSLVFDFRRFKSGGFVSALGNISVDLYLIEDTGAAGWTTSTPFDISLSTTTGTNAQVQTPVLVDATLTKVGSFTHSAEFPTTWQSGSIDFDLGTGTQYDQLVIRAGARHHLNAREVHAFDNFVITSAAVPEPTSLALVGVCGLALLRRRTR